MMWKQSLLNYYLLSKEEFACRQGFNQFKNIESCSFILSCSSDKKITVSLTSMLRDSRLLKCSRVCMRSFSPLVQIQDILVAHRSIISIYIHQGFLLLMISQLNFQVSLVVMRVIMFGCTISPGKGCITQQCWIYIHVVSLTL